MTNLLVNGKYCRVWCLWLVPTMSHGAKVLMASLLAQLLTTNKELVSPNGMNANPKIFDNVLDLLPCLR